MSVICEKILSMEVDHLCYKCENECDVEMYKGFISRNFSVHKECTKCLICEQKQDYPICQKCLSANPNCPFCKKQINQDDSLWMNGCISLDDDFHKTDHYECFEQFYLDKSFFGNLESIHGPKVRYSIGNIFINTCVMCNWQPTFDIWTYGPNSLNSHQKNMNTFSHSVYIHPKCAKCICCKEPCYEEYGTCHDLENEHNINYYESTRCPCCDHPRRKCLVCNKYFIVWHMETDHTYCQYIINEIYPSYMISVKKANSL